MHETELGRLTRALLPEMVLSYNTFYAPYSNIFKICLYLYGSVISDLDNGKLQLAVAIRRLHHAYSRKASSLASRALTDHRQPSE